MKTTGLKSPQQITDINESREVIKRLATVLNTFHVLNPGMEVQTILVFLEVGKHHPEPCPMSAVQDALQLARAATSRNVANLTSVDWRGEPGLDLIQSEIDLYDSRRRNLRLTKKGQAQIELFAKVLSNP